MSEKERKKEKKKKRKKKERKCERERERIEIELVGKSCAKTAMHEITEVFYIHTHAPWLLLLLLFFSFLKYTPLG